MKRILFVSMLMLISSLCLSQEKPNFAGFRAYTENDFLNPFSPNKDDNYTGGLRAELITNVLSPLWQKKLLNPLQWAPLNQRVAFTVTAFTPRDLASEVIVNMERPYASYQAFNLGASFANADSTKRLSYELSLGVMGKDLAGDLQTTIHKDHWFGSTRPVPQGWKYQIAEGGAFAANLKLGYEQLLSRKSSPSNFKPFSVSWVHELNVGQYMTNYMQGLRVYLFTKNAAPLLDEAVPELVSLFGEKKKHKPGITFFVTPRLRGVLHNTTLTGNLLSKESAHTLSSSEMNRILAEYEAALQLKYAFLRAGFTLYGRSKEYKASEKSFHHWGGPFLGFIARF